MIPRGNTIFQPLIAKLHALSRVSEVSLRSQLIGKLLLVFGLAAAMTLLIAAIAWVSFTQVVSTQAQIVDETIPTMEAVQQLSNQIARIAALVEQLPGVSSRDEAARIATALEQRLAEMRATLDRLEAHPVDHEQSLSLRSTAEAINANLRELAIRTERRLDLEQREREAFSRQRSAVTALLSQAETMVANASATTTANVVNLYRLVDRNSERNTLYTSMDRLLEVDIDAMERMLELQLVCAKIQSLLEQLEREQDAEEVSTIHHNFAEQWAALQRRVSDIQDPSLKKASLAHAQTLHAAQAENGVFALHNAWLSERQALQLLSTRGAQLAFRLNQQAGALVSAGGKAIEIAGKQARGAVDRGLIGFVIVAVLLFLALILTVWGVYRYHLLRRLSGMEKAARALSTGDFDIEIATDGNDPLAPLAQALAQVRENVRERERLEHELRRHHEELAEQVAQRTAELKESNALLAREVSEHALARQQAEDANAAKNLFLGSLSHELRTPLSGVSGAVRLMRETPLAPRQLEYINMIGYANSTLLEILEDMLSFSRIEAGKIELQQEAFDLHQALDDMLALQSIPAQSKGIALVSEIPADVPRFVIGDRGKLNQLLLNIIGNAIKFTDEGAVTLAITAQPSAMAGRVRLQFSVSDTGIGIPQEKIAEVFKPFFQVEETAHRRHSGAGLGLAICHRLVEAMGGSIGIESGGEHSGCCVTFQLELATVEALPASDGLTSNGVTSSGRALNVLVVEDDPINRTVCARYLELLGHHSLLAEDGKQALQLLGDAPQPIDAVLMDISLPGMSGFEVAEQLQALADGRWRHLPIIIMSAHVAIPTAQVPGNAEFAAFLGKPFTLDGLARALLGATESGREAAIPAKATADHRPLDFEFLNAELEALGEATILELLMLFKNELPTFFTALAADCQAHDWPALAARAHRLRSAAGNLGMLAVLGAARAVETASARATPDATEVGALISQLQTACVEGCEALYDWLLAQQDSATPA